MAATEKSHLKPLLRCEVVVTTEAGEVAGTLISFGGARRTLWLVDAEGSDQIVDESTVRDVRRAGAPGTAA